MYRLAAAANARPAGVSDVTEQEHQTIQPADARRLQAAIRKARIVQAERSDAMSDLREADIARLELLAEALEPVLQELPQDTSQFDCKVVDSDRPRLWVDMLAYVTMGRDRRTYRFMKSTRSGRQTLFETTRVGDMADHITDYIAHRIIEREKALDAETDEVPPPAKAQETAPKPEPKSSGGLGTFIMGVIVGAGVVILARWLTVAGLI